jgi:hypothetical protein
LSKFPLVGPSYTSQSVNADCQQTINLYPEQIESGAGNSNIVLYPSPGTKTFVSLQANITKEGTSATNVTGPCAPNEIVWTNPENSILNQPGSYARVSLNMGPNLIQTASGIANSGTFSGAFCTITLGAGHFVVLLGIGFTNPGLSFNSTVLGLPISGVFQFNHHFVGPADEHISMVYAFTGAGGTDTFQVISAGFDGGYAIVALEFENVPNGIGVDSGSGNFGSSVGPSLLTTGPITTTSNDLIVAASYTFGTVPTNGVGWTPTGVTATFSNAGIGGGNNTLFSGWQVGPAGSYEGTFNDPGADPSWIAQVAGLTGIELIPCSQAIVVGNFGISVPTGDGILGVAVIIGGHQTDLTADIFLNVQVQLADNTLSPTILQAQLPLSDGLITVGNINQQWGFALTPAIVNDPGFRVFIWAEAHGGESVEFNIYSIELQVWYA